MENLEIEKSIYLLKYVKIENSQTKDLHDKARDSFLNEIKTLHYEINVYDHELDKDYVIQGPSEEAKNSSDKDNQDQPGFKNSDITTLAEEDVSTEKPPAWAKALYRKIAMKTHPDRFKKDMSEDEKIRLVKIYEDATDFYSSYTYGELILCGIDAGVEIPRNKEVADYISQLTIVLESESTSLKKSVFWVWYHSAESEKKKILHEYVKIRGWTQSGSRIRKSPNRKRPGKSISWLRKKLEP
tara:strand:+ start:203 stop:928 length:726 start_codon:yes stop_codon:yes gene_type:complete